MINSADKFKMVISCKNSVYSNSHNDRLYGNDILMCVRSLRCNSKRVLSAFELRNRDTSLLHCIPRSAQTITGL